MEDRAVNRRGLFWQQGPTYSSGPGPVPTLRMVVALKTELVVESAALVDKARAQRRAARQLGDRMEMRGADADYQRAQAELEAARRAVDYWRRELRLHPEDADKPIWVPRRMGTVTLREPGQEG